jgi:hypothetical protein
MKALPFWIQNRSMRSSVLKRRAFVAIGFGGHDKKMGTKVGSWCKRIIFTPDSTHLYHMATHYTSLRLLFMQNCTNQLHCTPHSYTNHYTS